jgi:DNA mismatch repair protein MutS2
MSIDSLAALDFGTLKQMVSRFAQSPMGRRTVDNLVPLSSKPLITRELGMTTECLHLLESGHSAEFQDLGDYLATFEKLAVAELALEPQEILNIERLLECTEATRRSLGALANEAPAAAEVGRGLPDVRNLLSCLKGKIAPNGEVEDHASPLLKRIRNEINILRNRLYQALGRILERHSASQAIQDEVITLRNERFVIPVRVENRKELPGVVHGTSSSGATLFLEPLETLELNNELVRLKERAEEEIQNILRSLTAQIRERLEDLRLAVDTLGYLDFSFAKARFSREFRCVIPAVNDEGLLAITNGRHPTLERTLAAQQKNVVPISVELDRQRYILVISGPNTGGKTVALKTVGLLTLMALSGLPVPAASANVCVLKEVFTDIGDRQSIAENLSTFSSHLVNIREILETVSPPALVLMDELGTGTDPEEGSALGVAIVERLRSKGVLAVVTTHHNGLKMYATITPGVDNASVEFDNTTLQPTFRLIHGVPGNSSGIDIARRLGLDEALVSHARQLVSQEHQHVEQFSRHLREQMDQNTVLREQLQEELRSLRTRTTELESKSARAETQRQRQLEVARQQAFEGFEKESRKLLNEVRDKYLSVRARRELEKKGAQLREVVNRELAPVAEVPSESKTGSAPLGPVLVGSKVQVKRFGQEGTVIAAHGEGQWEVVVGNFKCVVDAKELSPTGASVAVQDRPNQSAARVTVQMNSPELQSNEINLVGCTVDEAIHRVDKFLDSAFLAAVSQVRLIHGTGMGVLRRALSEWLSNQPYVEKFHPAETGQGGNGVTVVSLKA